MVRRGRHVVAVTKTTDTHTLDFSRDTARADRCIIIIILVQSSIIQERGEGPYYEGGRENYLAWAITIEQRGHSEEVVVMRELVV